MAKLGVHVQAWTPHTLDAVVRMAPRVLKVMDPSLQPVMDVLSAHPNTIIVCRRFAEPSEQEAILLEGETGGSRWAYWVMDQYAAILSYCAGIGVPCYVEGLNEPPCFPDYAKWGDLNNRFTLGFVMAVKARGHRPLVHNFSVGNPPGTLDEMRYIWSMLVPSLRVAKEAGGALGLHEYGAPSMLDDASWHCLRYRRVYDLLPDDLHSLPLIIGECGIDGGLAGAGSPADAGWKHYASGEQYADQLTWYDKNLDQDPQVLGACIFTAGSSGVWDDFEIKDCEPVITMMASRNHQEVPVPNLFISPIAPVAPGGRGTVKFAIDAKVPGLATVIVHLPRKDDDTAYGIDPVSFVPNNPFTTTSLEATFDIPEFELPGTATATAQVNYVGFLDGNVYAPGDVKDFVIDPNAGEGGGPPPMVPGLPGEYDFIWQWAGEIYNAAQAVRDEGLMQAALNMQEHIKFLKGEVAADPL